jgi:hypothetical protein
MDAHPAEPLIRRAAGFDLAEFVLISMTAVEPGPVPAVRSAGPFSDVVRYTISIM